MGVCVCRERNMVVRVGGLGSELGGRYCLEVLTAWYWRVCWALVRHLACPVIVKQVLLFGCGGKSNRQIIPLGYICIWPEINILKFLLQICICFNNGLNLNSLCPLHAFVSRLWLCVWAGWRWTAQPHWQQTLSCPKLLLRIWETDAGVAWRLDAFSCFFFF